jgi:hypothetical protein
MAIRTLSSLLVAGIITNSMIADNAVDAAKLDETDDFNFTGNLQKDGAAVNVGAGVYYAVVDHVAKSNIANLASGAPSSISGNAVTTGQDVLVIGQNDQEDNGIYDVTSAGTGSNGQWARAEDRDTIEELPQGLLVFNRADDKLYKLTSEISTLGSDSAIFAEHKAGMRVSNGGELAAVGTGNASTTAFDLSVSQVAGIAVFVDGVVQPGSEYSISAGTGTGGVDRLVFANAPATDAVIEALIFYVG